MKMPVAQRQVLNILLARLDIRPQRAGLRIEAGDFLLQDQRIALGRLKDRIRARGGLLAALRFGL